MIRLYLAFLSMAGCVDSASDTGADTCCTFACDDATEGQIGFSIDDDDCAAYAEQQCGLNDAVVTQADFLTEDC